MKVLATIFMISVVFSGLVYSQDRDCYLMGLEKLKMRDYQEAVECFDQLLKKNRKNTRVLALRGYARAQMKDFKGAVKDFDAILKINPENSDAYNQRGICKKGLGDYEGALADFNRAILLNPLNKDAYSNRGVVKYKYMNDPQGATEDWLTAKNLGSPVATRLLKKYFFDPEGILKVSSGILLYANYPDLHFTFYLPGDPDFNYFPVIRLENGRVIEFSYNRKEKFGTTDRDVLKNIEKWKTDNQEKMYHVPVEAVEKKIFSSCAYPFNFWYYENPLATEADSTDKGDNPAKKVYFLNFIQGDYVFVISYPSVTGDDKEAGEFVMDMLNNFTFYGKDLDFDKLRKAIRKGRITYKE